jgi:hypothetical protein
VVCTLGNVATKLLSGNPAGITKVRGTPQVHELGGLSVFLLPLFHPAAALRTPAVKETLRSDFELLPDLVAGPPPSSLDPDELLEAEGEVESQEASPPQQSPVDQLDLFG